MSTQKKISAKFIHYKTDINKTVVTFYLTRRKIITIGRKRDIDQVIKLANSQFEVTKKEKTKGIRESEIIE